MPVLSTFLIAALSTLPTAIADGFPCAGGKDLPPMSEISLEEANERRCCLTLPCEFDVGCWAEQLPPLYSAPRAQAISRELSNKLEDELLLPRINSGELTKTVRDELPNHGWYRIPVPRGGDFEFFYEGVRDAFNRTFRRELETPVDLDIFYIDDFDSHWSSDETYASSYPGAAYWIHNDCSNFRICYEETPYKGEDFTGNGVAFVLPVALPSKVDFRDGHDMMPAGLELYNISHGHRDEAGDLQKPWNRQWMDVYRYNLGEIIFFNAFRWHSGHVPRASEFLDKDNPDHKRAETVGFAAELKTGKWVLFRMCKGSTDDKAKEKILDTDVNLSSTGAATENYVLSAEEAMLHELSAESCAMMSQQTS
mmetsp:Transcript_19374/g.30754  ORF Transcript_19374/g.30754 Transcript_19374/m.30754 type:complete len:367 (+) Transcript_19374:78-1178(+)